MSKVLSFSISDRYLNKIRSLYPELTENLAAKQFLIDQLDAGLDDNLDNDLDDKLKTIIETSLDGILDERLDATVGKLITSLSERMARLEARLDTNLDGGLDDKLDYGLPYQPSKNELTETQRRVLESRQLAKAKLEHAAYLVKNPLVVRDLSKKQPVETAIDKVESVTDKVESDSIGEPVTGSIDPVPGDSDSIESVTGEAVTIGNKPWYTIDDLLDCHYPGWPETKEGLRKKALTEGWPRRTRRGSKGNPYEYQAVLPEWHSFTLYHWSQPSQVQG